MKLIRAVGRVDLVINSAALAMRTHEKFGLSIGALLLLTLAFGTLVRRQSPEAGLEFCGEPSAGSNGHLTFGLTNPTHLAICYLIYPYQLKLNGAWPELQRFSRSSQGFVLPLTNVSFSVAAPQVDVPWRIPIVWYFDRPKTWAAMLHRAEFWLTGRHPVWHIVLHTNFSSEIVLAKESNSL